jgi:PiT family inorganic phosphate transporter
MSRLRACQRACPIDGVELLLIVVVVITALAFDFTNGFHDTANAMATSIATGALKPKTAVVLAGLLNLVGAFLSISVAATIANGIVDQGLVTPAIVFAGLMGAICWNLVTWLIGLPSSSSHALIGGVAGAALVAGGTHAVKFSGILSKVVIPAVIAPLLAAAAACLATWIAYRVTARTNPARSERMFKRGQIASASLVSLAHGTNDAQKTMGVITLALISGGMLPAGARPPLWVIVSAGVAIAAGTYIGGWRIIRTLGRGLTDISAPQGFAAQTSASAVILISSHFGFPLSTTHVCSGGIVGSGLGRKLADIRWGLAGRMVLGWLVTLPAAAGVGALVTLVARSLGNAAGILVMAAVLVVFGAVIFAVSRRNRVDHTNVNELPPPVVPLGSDVKAAA